MGIAAAVALLLVVLFSVGLLVVLFFVRAQKRSATRPPLVNQGPAYRKNLASIGYYRPEQDSPKTGDVRSVSEPRQTDPRKMPLPRCPKCGVAIAFTDERCPKCLQALERA